MTNHNWSSIVKSIQIANTKILGTEIKWPLVQHAFGCVPIDVRWDFAVILYQSLLFSNFPSSLILANSKKSINHDGKNDIIFELWKKENLGLAIFVEDKGGALLIFLVKSLSIFEKNWSRNSTASEPPPLRHKSENSDFFYWPLLLGK